MTQEQLTILDAALVNLINQYRDGLTTAIEFMDAVRLLRDNIKDADIAGLLDPASGLRYPSVEELAVSDSRIDGAGQEYHYLEVTFEGRESVLCDSKGTRTQFSTLEEARGELTYCGPQHTFYRITKVAPDGVLTYVEEGPLPYKAQVAEPFDGTDEEDEVLNEEEVDVGGNSLSNMSAQDLYDLDHGIPRDVDHSDIHGEHLRGQYDGPNKVNV